MAQNTISKDVKTDRHLYIGGSDIASVMGESRYKTPFKLWCEKTGRIPAPNLDNVESVHFGTILEDVVAKEFTRRTGKAVRQAPKGYVHPEYDYMVAHIDRIITGTDELLECKTTNFFKADEWQGENIPNEYILQVQWYLGITGRKKGYIACLIGGNQFNYKCIEFDSELFDLMVKCAKDFWEKIQTDTPPELVANDDETMRDLYGSSQSDLIIDMSFPNDEREAEAITDVEETVAYLQQLKGERKSIDDEIKTLETKLKDLIKDNLGIKTTKYLVTWKLQNGSYTYDKEQMLSDGVFEKYATQSSFRRLNVKDLNKKAGK